MDDNIMFYTVPFQVPFTIVLIYQVNPSRNLALIIAEAWGREWGFWGVHPLESLVSHIVLS